MSNFGRPSGSGRLGFFTPVIKFLIIANIAVFVIENFVFSVFTFGGHSLRDLFFYYCALFPLGDDSNFYLWQLISYQFMHADIMHIFFNLFALWMFGIELEQIWGSKKFLIFYLLCGIGAGLTQLLVTPIFSVPGPTIGASGAVYGILLAFGLTFPDRPIFMFPIFIPIPAKFFVLIYAGISLFSAFSKTTGGIAHFAHLGGAATGFLLIKFGDKLGLFRFLERLFSSKNQNTNIYSQQPVGGGSSKIYQTSWHKSREEAKPEPRVNAKLIIDDEEITQGKVDEILDKISAQGYQSLTEKEKLILYKLSQKLK